MVFMLFTKNYAFLSGLAMFATIVCKEFLLRKDETTIANTQTNKLFNVEYFKGMKINEINKQTNKQKTKQIYR